MVDQLHVLAFPCVLETDSYLGDTIVAINTSINGKLYSNSMYKYYAIEWRGIPGFAKRPQQQMH